MKTVSALVLALGLKAKHPGGPKPTGVCILQARYLAVEREQLHYTLSSAVDIQGSEDGLPDRCEIAG